MWYRDPAHSVVQGPPGDVVRGFVGMAEMATSLMKEGSELSVSMTPVILFKHSRIKVLALTHCLDHNIECRVCVASECLQNSSN